MTGGWHNAFMAPRGIKNMEEINYKVKYKKNSLKRMLEQASRHCIKRNKYNLNMVDITSEASNVS